MRSDVFSSFLEPDNSRVPDFAGVNGVDHVERLIEIDCVMRNFAMHHTAWAASGLPVNQ
jgi:hypothetical protein